MPDAEPQAMPELLDRDFDVAGIAEAADVAVVVGAALRERYDVIRYRRRGHDAALGTASTQGLCRESPKPQLHRSPTARTLNRAKIAMSM